MKCVFVAKLKLKYNPWEFKCSLVDLLGTNYYLNLT